MKMQNKTVREQSKKRPREKEEKQGEEEENETGLQENNGTEPPKKMTKKEKKEMLIEKKRRKNPNIDKSIVCKRLWEELLQHAARNGKKTERPKDEKSKKLLNQIVEYLREDWNRFACQHDMSRVIQTVLKLGSDEHVLEVFKALKPNLNTLSKDKFGHNIVMKLLTYTLDKTRFNSVDKRKVSNHELRKEFFDQLFKGQMKSMLKQKFPAAVVDHAFRTIWTPAERILFLQEFYGSDFWLSDLTQIQNTDLVSVSLKEKLAEFPGKRKPVLDSLNTVVTKIIEKRLFDLELAQKLIIDFFENADPGPIQNIIYDLCEKDAIPFIFHTLFGCKIAIYCTAYGASRDRKRIIKSICQNTAEGDETSIVLRTAKIFYGSVFLRYLLSVTDDTTKSKQLLKDIEKNMVDMLSDQHAHKVVLYLFNQTHKTCNENGDLELLNPILREEVLPRTNKEGKRVVSMKAREDIFKELASYMVPHIFKTIKNNMVLLGDKHAQYVIYEILANSSFPDKKELYEKIASSTLSDMLNIISDPIASKTLSLLIRNQKLSDATEECPLFAQILFQKVKEDNKLIELIKNKKAGFVIAAMLTAGENGGDKQISDEINLILKENMKSITEEMNKKGEPSIKFLVTVFNKKNNIQPDTPQNGKGKKAENGSTANKKKASRKSLSIQQQQQQLLPDPLL